MSEPLFSRSPCPHPLGKCDSEVKVAMPEQVRDAVTALAALAGQTVSEFLRDLICRDLYGEWNMLRLQHQRSRERNADIMAESVS